MSLMDPEYAAREQPQHSSPPTARKQRASYTTEPTAAAPTTNTHHRQDSYDEAIYTEFYQPMQQQEKNDDSTMDNSTTLITRKAFAANIDAATQTSPAAPPLPQRNMMRQSRLLDGLNLMKMAEPMDADLARAATPLDMYLSSEEDASSSADDSSDYDWESSSEYGSVEEEDNISSSSSCSPPRGRRSHEITARVVSVVFSGKPAIVELSSPTKTRQPTNASSTSIDSSYSSAVESIDEEAVVEPASVPLPSTATSSPLASMLPSAAVSSASLTSSVTSSSTTSSRRQSIAVAPTAMLKNRASVSSFASAMAPNAAMHPPRQSSMLAAILHKQKRTPPPFLSIDPYANGSTYSLDLQSPQHRNSRNSVASPATLTSASTVASEEDAFTPKTPRTPTAVLKDLSRSFGGLARKRSRPNMNPAIQDQSPSVESPARSIQEPPKIRMLQKAQRTATAPAISTSVPNNTKSPQDTPVSPTPDRKGGLFGGISARRRSIKLTGRII